MLPAISVQTVFDNASKYWTHSNARCRGLWTNEPVAKPFCPSGADVRSDWSQFGTSKPTLQSGTVDVPLLLWQYAESGICQSWGYTSFAGGQWLDLAEAIGPVRKRTCSQLTGEHKAPEKNDLFQGYRYHDKSSGVQWVQCFPPSVVIQSCACCVPGPPQIHPTRSLRKSMDWFRLRKPARLCTVQVLPPLTDRHSADRPSSQITRPWSTSTP